MDKNRLQEIIICLGENGYYREQGNYFLKKTNTKFFAKKIGTTTEFIKGMTNAVYKITLSNDKKTYSFNFHQSANATEKRIKPTAYDVLTCLTKYELETFADFCWEFGYEKQVYNDNIDRWIDNVDAIKIYTACLDEYKNIQLLWTSEEIEALQEIN